MSSSAHKIGNHFEHIIDVGIVQTGINANPESPIHNNIRVAEIADNPVFPATHIGLMHQVTPKEKAGAYSPLV